MHQMVVLPFRRTLTGWKKWAKRNFMKFNKGKHQVLHLGRNKPRYHYLLAEEQLCREEPDGLVDTMLTMIQQYALAAVKADSSCAGLGRALLAGCRRCSFLSTQPWWATSDSSAGSSEKDRQKHSEASPLTGHEDGCNKIYVTFLIKLLFCSI